MLCLKEFNDDGLLQQFNGNSFLQQFNGSRCCNSSMAAACRQPAGALLLAVAGCLPGPKRLLSVKGVQPLATTDVTRLLTLRVPGTAAPAFSSQGVGSGEGGVRPTGPLKMTGLCKFPEWAIGGHEPVRFNGVRSAHFLKRRP